ncbi:RING finger protein 37 [Triplophysa tibetana]|uniref:RING finger protein 37 n=1 Tax=Triplophysa tibetana TaxID=1572043 RepID=A0A5A9P028_9TELE|nr:RING finger protein 37 [Triplophysa tibetana]
MVLNLCEAHFQTTIQCNKLCADGYDVTNLLSEDPLTRRRGLRLEYFLPPPLHVTLAFRVKMELCRVDVELWPWRSDQGKKSRGLEIFSSPDGDRGQFKLVCRCDLQDEVQVRFHHPNFKPRPPFLDLPPQGPAQIRRVDLWSRGPQSLDSVAQLRVSIPYSGAATALGIKSLAVWAVPARCCSSSEVEKFHKGHLKSLRINPPSAVPTSEPLEPDDVPPDIPEEFLDPLTQELLVFPMILPSGMVIDNSTLEEYQKREATWGRLPNDPFTGVPFAQNSKPLPNPLLKCRIDRLVLQTGCTRVQNTLTNKPQASRLIVSAETSANSNSGDDDPEPSASQLRTLDDVRHDEPVACTSESALTSRKTLKRKYECSFPSIAVDCDAVTREMVAHTTTESHEQRLAHSLDEALNQALHGLPTFTSQSKSASSGDASDGQHKCLFCSCLLSVYSWSVLSYSLPCGHLMCGACLQSKRPSDSQRLKIECPSCGTFASSSDITRVHH